MVYSKLSNTEQESIMSYYSLDKIKSTKADIRIVIGQRSNGKTYAVCKEVLEIYKAKRKRFCYIRRWDEDIKSYRAEQLFTPLQSVIEKLFGKGYTVVYYRHKYYLVNEKGEKLDCIGYALSLSSASHTKSVAYVDVQTIFYDEFIQMSGERVLRDEKDKFENTLSTIIREKQDVVVYLLANTVSKFSPYFVYYGYDINRVKQGDIAIREIPTDDNKGILRVALEYCEYNEEIGKKVSKYTTSKMIRTGQWEIPPTDDIPTVKGEKVKERLLCTFQDPDAEVIIGCLLRRAVWSDIQVDEVTKIYHHVEHEREFLVLRQIERRSKYYHLTKDKSLDYHTYNDMSYFLADIKDTTDIDIEHELFMGRIFCDNMFTADYFNHIWQFYGGIKVRDIL